MDDKVESHITKKRRPFIALLFSLILPGFGQIYNAQLKKGIVFFLVQLIFPTVLLLPGLLEHFSGAVVYIVIVLGIYLSIAGDAFVVARKKGEALLKRYNKGYAYSLFFIIAIALSITYDAMVDGRLYHYKSYKIPAVSMYPTFDVGDYIMADMKHYAEREPERGDLAIFLHPKDRSMSFIKRIIAVGGDVIEGGDKVMYLNGNPLDEPYVHFDDEVIKAGGRDPRDNFGPLTVPENKYFMMGDNRDQSYDSRDWGFVDSDDLLGKPLYVYFSWDKEGHTIRFGRIGKSVN